MDERAYKRASEISSHYLREYAYKNGEAIYAFMEKYNIGKSAYGSLMDSAAKGKNVMAHRLYGHHLIYDLPLSNPNKIPAFLEHELSDLFTKMGLPIIPGEILENTTLLKYCKGLSKNWNFINGFDLLSGTVALWKGIEKINETFIKGYSVDTFEEFANTFGIGALELALAMSSANPLLLIAAILHLTSGVKGLINDGSVIFFRKNIEGLLIEFSINSLNIEAYLKLNSIDNSINSLSINSSLNKVKILNWR
jgi:hypothetical protein